MKNLRYEKGMSVVEVLILTGILVILLIGGLYAYRYFSSTQTNVRNIATIQGSQSQSSFENSKVGGVDFGAAALMDYSGSTTFATATSTVNLTGSAIPTGKFILVYRNSSYDKSVSDVSTELGTTDGLSKAKGEDIFTDANGNDRIPTVDIPMSAVYILMPQGTNLSSSAGLKKLPNATKTVAVNATGTGVYDVYKIN